MRIAFFTPFLALALAGCATTVPSQEVATSPAPADGEAAPAPAPRHDPTRILDPQAAARLLGAHGITLQWIEWDRRGTVFVRKEGGTILLTGTQSEENGPGRLFMDGAIDEVGTGYFVFRGTIRITDTPDRGRVCEADKTWHFAVTQNRPYWRLREFEWCDGLTDYVDIYF